MPRRPSDIRKRLVQTALKLFASRGYYNTSIGDILGESGCKRGSLYYYFSSKEELGYAAIDELVRLFLEEEVASHLRTGKHPIDRMLDVLDNLPVSVKLEVADAPVIGLGVRMATVHEGFRQHLARGLETMAEGVEEMMRKGIANGHIVNTVDPRQVTHVAMILAHGIQMASLLGHGEVISEDLRRWMKEYLNSLRR